MADLGGGVPRDASFLKVDAPPPPGKSWGVLVLLKCIRFPLQPAETARPRELHASTMTGPYEMNEHLS